MLMSDMHKPVIISHEGTFRHHTLRSKSTIALNLGELRALIDAAAGMSDKAEVTFSGISSAGRYDECWVKNVYIREEIKNG